MAKSCLKCGVDVEGKPRVKDTQGHYYCQQCHEKVLLEQADRARERADQAKARQKATGASPPAAIAFRPADDADIMGNVLDETLKKVGGGALPIPCAECGTLIPAHSVICTHCGFNKETGKQSRTRVEVNKEPKVKKEDGGGGGLSLNINPLWVGVGGVALLGGTFLWGYQGDQIGAMCFLASTGLISLAFLVLLFVEALQDSVLHAIGAVLFFPYAVYYTLVEAENSVLTTLLILVVISNVLWFALSTGDNVDIPLPLWRYIRFGRIRF